MDSVDKKYFKTIITMNISKEIINLIYDRQKLRENQQYQEADKIRDKLLKKDIKLEDSKDGVSVFILKPWREYSTFFRF